MTAHGGAAVWCIVQTALLAGLGLAAIGLLVRRAPASAALAGLVAACMILLATVMIPVTIPPLLPAPATIADGEKSSPPDSHRAADAETERAKTETAADRPLQIEFREALEKLKSFAGSGATVAPDGGLTMTLAVLVIFGIGAVVGLGRLAMAAAIVAGLRRSATPIADPVTLRQFAELRELLGVKRRVLLCESNGIASPALIGWRRPIVLLPTDRAGWRDDQVQATLAHELAHVVRGDFVGRVLSQLALAIHYSQPLVHWLARRAALMQELATDRLAAKAVGGPLPYARALSGLVLRLDDHSRLRLEPVVLPAISSHLTRRMAMLRTQDGTIGGGWQRVGGAAAVGLIVLVGVMTIALRGAAEPADSALNADKVKKAFDASPLDLAFMGSIETGRIVIRPYRMTQRSALAPLVDFIQTSLNASAATKDGSAAWRPRLETVDFYAMQMHTNVDLSDPAAIERHQGIAISADLALRFTDDAPANEFWEQTKKTPQAETIDSDGFAYVRVAAEPMGDQVPVEPIVPMYIAKRDDRTFIISDNVERLQRMVNYASASTAESTDEAAARWATLDGGLVTAYGDKQATELGMLFWISMAPHLAVFGESLATESLGDGMTILHNDIDSFGIGVDLDPETNDAKVCVMVRCNDEAAAGRVTAAIAALQSFASMQLSGISSYLSDPAQLASLSSDERATLDAYVCWTQLLAEAKVKSLPSASQVVELKVDASAPFPQQIGLMLPTAAPAPTEAK